MLDGHGRVALVTGANRGIGRAVAETLYARGWSVGLGVRSPPSALPLTVNWDPARCHVGRYDAEDRDARLEWVEAALERFGRIDALVNNAGVSTRKTIRDVDEATLDRVWAVNCKAPLDMIRLCLPHLEASGAGRIVNVASLSGKRVRNDDVAYNMSKFAVMALTHAARRIAWDKGVRATAVCPSFVDTDMVAGSKALAPDRMIQPADLAILVATVLELPNTAAIAELLVNCRLEDTV